METGLILLEISILFIVPVILIFLGLPGKKYRLHLFAFIFLIAATITYLRHWPLQKLGIDLGHITNGLFPYSAFTLLGIIFVVALAKALQYKSTPKWWKIPHFIFGFILISIAQEFLYRGFLMPELESVFHSIVLIVLVNAALFSFLHIIYPNRLVNLLLAFIGGLCFAALYYHYPNLILISLSHMALNFAVVYFGMFSFRDNKELGS